MSRVVHLALGSNLGDRQATLDAAARALEAAGVRVVARSRSIETAPVGGPAGQPAYLNAALAVATSLTPVDLLATLHRVEADLGRVRTVKDGPRTLDLDLLIDGDAILGTRDASPIVPHPRMQDRAFVLEPLAEIAPNVRHPVFGRTVAELLARLRAREAKATRGELGGMRVAVVGATSGIGRAVALELARAGADVVVHGRDAVRADQVVAQCQPGDSVALLADLAEPTAACDLVDRAWRMFDGLDAWVHVAGADTLTGPSAKWSFEQKLDALWNVDVRAALLACRRVGERMKLRGQGAILTMGWDQCETGMEGDSGQLFGATKAAVTAFSRSLALSLAPEVRVNVLAPGWIRTAWGETASDVWQQRVLRETPLRRWGEPSDLAATARWLLSQGAAFVTGQTLRVNGGAIRG